MVWSCLENSDSCFREKEQVDSCLGNGKMINIYIYIYILLEGVKNMPINDVPKNMSYDQGYLNRDPT